MEHVLEFSLNIAMITLLAATLFYCWLLNKRIQVLQDSKSELANLLKQFDRSTKRASEAMELLQQASKQAGKSVQSRIEKAQYVLDDLNYMMDRADKVAEQMEAGIAIARQREKLEPAISQKTSETSAFVEPPSTVPLVASGYPKVEDAAPARTKSSAANESVSAQVVPTPAANQSRSLVLEQLGSAEQGANGAGMSREGEGMISGVTRDSILASLRQAKAGGKENDTAMSSLQSLIEKVAERHQHDAQDEPQRSAAQHTSTPRDARPVAKPSVKSSAARASRGERELLRAMQLQAE